MVLVLREIMMSAVGVRVVVRRYTLQVVIVLLTVNDLVFVSCILLIDQTKMTHFLSRQRKKIIRNDTIDDFFPP